MDTYMIILMGFEYQDLLTRDLTLDSNGLVNHFWLSINKS
jgi:hypothetical protein